MYLKNLALLGFKSFADKTVLNFLPGVTAIVGPNGCGKSNLSDAIRWVLGEQSARALRGGEMADVIFNGAETRKPIALAEVSLTLGDVDQEHLHAAGVAVSYNEVTLTRRVFRDGSSEYFINKTSCRLKDIQQLFMGTGVGRASYSIMAQGNITQLLSSKPEERRMVFEEAAGITKFKAQKRETLRKLELTDQNLLRVTDLIREVKRQIGSLQRQAGKARRYKQFQAELQHLETQLARHQFDEIRVETEAIQTAITGLIAAVEEGTENALQAEEEIGQWRTDLAAIGQQAHLAQQTASDLKAQAERHQERILVNTERIRELDLRSTQASQDLSEAEERQAASEIELTRVSETCVASGQNLAIHREAAEERQRLLAGFEERQRDLQKAARQSQAEEFSTAQQLARVRGEIASLDSRKQANLLRLERLAAEKVQLEEERSRLQTNQAEFAGTVENDRRQAETSRGTLEERQTRLRDIQLELHHSGGALEKLVRQQAELRSRLDLLRQLQTEYEGFSEGALAALKSNQRALGSLADRIKAPAEFLTAIEAALGHHLQLVLAKDPEAAQAIVSDLRAHRRGRASVAALALPYPAAESLEPAGVPNGAPEAVQPAPASEWGRTALSLIECDPEITPLLGRLLGRTRIVGDLAEATSGWEATGGLYNFVTVAGESLDVNGVYTGGLGSASARNSSSILGRKNQIAELEIALGSAQENLNEASRARGRIQAEQTTLQAGLHEAQADLRRQEVAIATREGEFSALQDSLRKLQQRIEVAVYETQSLTALELEGQAKRDGLVAELNGLERRQQELASTAAGVNADLESLTRQREAGHRVLMEAKVAVAAEEQVHASLRRQQESLRARIRELAQQAQQRKSEIEGILPKRSRHEAETVESCTRIESLKLELERAQIALNELEGRRLEQGKTIAAREEDWRQRRAALADLQQQRGGKEIELTQKNMALGNLAQRILEKYQIRLEDVRGECITITYAQEGPAQSQTLTPEEMAAAGAATDWAAVAEQVASLQKRIDEMGPVNLVAIEEYEEAEERHRFLSAQQDDLALAKQQLLDAINRINTETRELFSATFIKIRDNFRLLFSEIFGGGKADLVLVNEGDILESGIDIVARHPPGKQLQTISLLSGGEQTMTAVAILFAIYQVRPSPFCVLDELDAPLDESNINRFVRVLQRFIGNSQFVIITHNKRTIEMADVIYGVTMQEQGISKIISMKLRAAEKTPPLSAPVESAAPAALTPAASLNENATDAIPDAAPEDQPSPRPSEPLDLAVR